jgi:hypothetical protein
MSEGPRLSTHGGLIHETANQIVASRLFGCLDLHCYPCGVGVLRWWSLAGRTDDSRSDCLGSVARDNQQPRIDGDGGNNK